MQVQIQSGRMLRTGKTGVIGLVFSEALPYAFQDPVAIAFLQGVCSLCEKVKASLLIIVPTLESDAAQMTIQQPLIEKGAIAAELLLGISIADRDSHKTATAMTDKIPDFVMGGVFDLNENRHMVLETKLVVRESSGSAPIQLR